MADEIDADQFNWEWLACKTVLWYGSISEDKMFSLIVQF